MRVKLFIVFIFLSINIYCEEKIYFSKTEYYFDFIGKPVPSHFVHMNDDFYEPPNNNPTLGREIISVKTINGIVCSASMFSIFSNFTEWFNWTETYLKKIKELRYRRIVDKEGDMVFCTNENNLIVMRGLTGRMYGENDFYTSHFEFIIMD